MRPVIPVLLTVLLLVGCLGPSGSTGTPAVSTTETETPTATDPTTVESTAAKTTTETAPSDANNRNTVIYESLNERQQAAVDAAIRRTTQFVPDTRYVSEDEGFSYELDDLFENNEYVLKEGTYYEIDIQGSGDLYAQYDIGSTPAEPGANETARPLSDLPENVRDEVRWAIENRTHVVPFGKWHSLPDSLDETRYVRYENETYRLGYSVGDFWASELRLRRVR